MSPRCLLMIPLLASFFTIIPACFLLNDLSTTRTSYTLTSSLWLKRCLWHLVIAMASCSGKLAKRKVPQMLRKDGATEPIGSGGVFEPASIPSDRDAQSVSESNQEDCPNQGEEKQKLSHSKASEVACGAGRTFSSQSASRAELEQLYQYAIAVAPESEQGLLKKSVHWAACQGG